MAIVNDAKQEINAKIVYFGPVGAGKATALRTLYGRIRPECRSPLKTLQAGPHRMMFFDFTYPAPLRQAGYTVRFHVYTLMLDGPTPPNWKLLLKGADGVVLLADSAPDRCHLNAEAHNDLRAALGMCAMTEQDLEIAYQANKRDLADAVPLESIAGQLSLEAPVAVSGVVAASGKGLLEGLQQLIQGILTRLGQLPAPDCGVTTPVLADTDTVAAQPLLPVADGGAEPLKVTAAGETIVLDDNTVGVPLRLQMGSVSRDVTIRISIT
jgi:signal recognition particle receptor subunit beta